MTKVFIFLGNEREELRNSRHNAGFIVAEEIREVQKLPAFERKEAVGICNYEYLEHEINGEKVYFVKPQAIDSRKYTENGEKNIGYSFGDINQSGFAVKKFVEDIKLEGAKISAQDIFVVVDSLSKEKHPSARYVAKSLSEDETHNGVKSIGNEFGGGFVIIEIPIGKQGVGKSVKDYVSEDFKDEERLAITSHSGRIAKNLSQIVSGNIGDFNNAVKKDSELPTKKSPGKTKSNNSSKNGKKDIGTTIVNTLTQDSKTERDKIEFLTKMLVSNVTRLNKEGSNQVRIIIDKAKEYELLDKLIEFQSNSDLEDKFKIRDKCLVDDLKLLGEYGFDNLGKPVLEIKTNEMGDSSLKDAMDKRLSELVEEDKIELLTKVLINSFTKKSNTSQAAFNTTRIILDKAKEYGLLEKLIDSQFQVSDEKYSILQQVIEKNTCPEQIEVLLDSGFGRLVDSSFREKTFLKKVLEKDNVKESLPIFWQIYRHSDDGDNIRDCVEYAKENQEKFKLSKNDNFSDLEIGRILPHQLLLARLNEIKIGKKPIITTPYYDYVWGRSPKQVLQDMGCELSTPQYNIADDSLFESEESIQKLRKEISKNISQSNGLVVLGNNGNVDEKFYNANLDKVDLEDFYQRRTFVEMLAFKEALKLGLPIWTICGGTQMAIVALGGEIENLQDQQNLRGSEDFMKVKKNSLIDAGEEFANTFSAHYQGINTKKVKGQTYLKQTDRFSVYERADDFSFENLPAGVEVVAVSDSNPDIPKAYTLYNNGQEVALMMQSHLETDPSQNQTSFMAIKGFVDKCSNQAKHDQVKPAIKAEKIEKLLQNRVQQIS